MRILVWIIIVGLCVGGYTYWKKAGRRSETQEAPVAAPAPPAAVVIGSIELSGFSETVEALGTIQAMEATEITANVSETVAELLFEDGQVVKAGELLARLTSDEEQAMLLAARANEAEQEREIKRLQGLVQDGAVPEVRLQEYQTRRDVARQQVREVEARLEDRQIRAPFAGVLGVRRVSVGALVNPGTVMATLDALDRVKLDFTVPETFLGELKEGQNIEAQSQAYPGTAFAGQVSHVDTRVNPVTRAVSVRALLDNSELKLRPGMLMRVVLRSRPRQSPTLPERGLVGLQNQHFVFQFTPDQTEAEAGSVRRQPVRLGGRKPGYVEIVEGLEPGAWVVTDGLLGLVDGARVVVKGRYQGPAPAYNPLNPETPTP